MKIGKIHRILFLLTLALFIIASISTLPTFAQDSEEPIAQDAENPIIEIYPAKIDVMIETADIPKIPNATIFVTARQANLTRVSINATDLFEEQNRRFWIPAESINSTKNGFNLTEGRTIDIKLLFGLPEGQPPGSYVGKIIVRDENGGLAEIQITVKLRENNYYPLILIGLGVLASLIISISRWHIESEDSTKNEIKLTDIAIFKAENENRRDYRYIEAKDLQTQYQIDFQQGDYKEAKEKAIKARFLAEQAAQPATLTKVEDLVNLLNQVPNPISKTTILKIGVPSTLVDQIQNNDKVLTAGKYAGTPSRNRWSSIEHLLKDLGIGPSKKKLLIYGSATIVILIVMAQAWEAFYPRIVDFGASWIDYITAFLYGFSGQSFLSAFADLGKRWIG